MANATKETFDTLREMNDLMAKHGVATILVTTSGKNAFRQAFTSMRAEDVGWYGVKLKERLLPPSAWTEGERGGVVKWELSLVPQDGKVRGRVSGLCPADRQPRMRPAVGADMFTRMVEKGVIKKYDMISVAMEAARHFDIGSAERAEFLQLNDIEEIPLGENSVELRPGKSWQPEADPGEFDYMSIFKTKIYDPEDPALKKAEEPTGDSTTDARRDES